MNTVASTWFRERVPPSMMFIIVFWILSMNYFRCLSRNKNTRFKLSSDFKYGIAVTCAFDNIKLKQVGADIFFHLFYEHDRLLDRHHRIQAPMLDQNGRHLFMNIRHRIRKLNF